MSLASCSSRRRLITRGETKFVKTIEADAQRMRTWSYAQVKMHISNDNAFEAEELALLRTERTRRSHALETCR